MEIQNLVSKGNMVQFVVSLNDLKDVCSFLFNEERIRQEKLKESENNGLLNSVQVKELLKVKDGTLWKWNKRGYLPHVKIGSRNFYKRDDVDRILGKKSNNGGPEKKD